jgi:hypothetical protein
MELLYENLINTTTMISVNSNTTLVENLFNPDRRIQYFSDGFANDSTVSTIRINFSATTPVSRIAIMEHNIEAMTIFYNGVTANTFSLTGPTTTSDFASLTSTDIYLQMSAAVNVTSVSFDIKRTITANSEKAIGHLVLSTQLLDFSQIPNASGYTPKLDPKQIVHTLSDGGTRLHVVRDKWSASIKLSQVNTTFRDQLRDVYEMYSPMIFVPFNTSSSWDAILFECVWTGPFTFYKFSDNAATVGFSGDISLKETAS